MIRHRELKYNPTMNENFRKDTGEKIRQKKKQVMYDCSTLKIWRSQQDLDRDIKKRVIY